MAGAKNSWRKRRWELFLAKFQSDANFRKALRPVAGRPAIYRVLAKYSIPSECVYAIMLYLNNPNLKEEEYLKEILPPIYFLNAVVNTARPKKDHFLYDSGERTAHAFVAHQLGSIKEDMGLSLDDIVELTKKIFGGFTALFVSPYIKKQELHDFIDEYWGELEPLINTSYAEQEGVGAYSREQIITMQEEFAKKVYPAKTTKNWERDNMIMELTAEGLNDSQIATKLFDAGYGSYTTTYIRQIRHRQKKK